MIIGLHGQMRSGKDTSAEFLLDWANSHGHRVSGGRRDAFADRLKLSAARALGFQGGGVAEAVEFCNMLKHPGTIIEVVTTTQTRALTGREYLQYYGTEAHREVFDPDFWIDAVLSNYTDPNELFVVTDVRFENEAEAILGVGGEVWHIVRPETDRPDTDLHASEKVLPDHLITRTILNDAGLDELRDRVLIALALAGHAGREVAA